MQGFNKYHSPDFDPSKTASLNAYHGKHALGDRARKIDQGILIVRFEMPWNSWCGTCSAHIGAGVRYNAEKKKVGNYLSTPIFGFRCKCHLCSGWFEIRTDPKNSAYVVHEGLKKKQEDWDPEENGGYAVHDTDAPSASLPPTDPFAHLERVEIQKSLTQTRAERLSSLYSLSTATTSDPYTLSSRLRSSFRTEKKVRQGKEREDDGMRDRYGLGERVKLLEGVEGEGSEAWKVARGEREKSEVGRRKRIEGRERTEGGVQRLGKLVVGNERRRSDPFGGGGGGRKVLGGGGGRKGVGPVGELVSVVKRSKSIGSLEKVAPSSSVPKSSTDSSAVAPPAGLSALGGYESD